MSNDPKDATSPTAMTLALTLPGGKTWTVNHFLEEPRKLTNQEVERFIEHAGGMLANWVEISQE